MTTAQRPAAPIRLHHFPLSGHSHRALLFLSLLGLPYEVVPVDFMKGEHQSPAFLAVNPLGQVPVIQDGELTLADSNAILVYLARRYDPDGHWIPKGAQGEAALQRWFSLAAGWLAFGPAHCRIGKVFGRPIEERGYAIAGRLLGEMERTLGQHRWLLEGSAPSLADVSMYTYTAHAPEGGIDLSPYPSVRRWLGDVEALPGFVGMPRSPSAVASAA